MFVRSDVSVNHVLWTEGLCDRQKGDREERNMLRDLPISEVCRIDRMRNKKMQGGCRILILSMLRCVIQTSWFRLGDLSPNSSEMASLT